LALSWSVAPGSLATAANARSFRRTPSSDPISPLMRIVGDLNTAAKGPRWARRASYQDDQRRGPHRFREHGAPATSPVRSAGDSGVCRDPRGDHDGSRTDSRGFTAGLHATKAGLHPRRGGIHPSAMADPWRGRAKHGSRERSRLTPSRRRRVAG
jgi:hypothetical protein